MLSNLYKDTVNRHLNKLSPPEIGTLACKLFASEKFPNCMWNALMSVSWQILEAIVGAFYKEKASPSIAQTSNTASMSGGDTRLCFVGVAECGDQVKQVPSPSIVQTSNIASMPGGDTRLLFCQ